MNTTLKLLCIGLYLLGAASALGQLPESWHLVGTLAALLLAAHAIELVIMFKHVKRYPGPLAISVLLTILFGLLHWKPLADQAKRESQTQAL